MSLLLHGDCLEKLQEVENNSVDLIFCDLPYGQTSCKWDKLIDIDKLWKEIMRVKKINTPIFFTTTTKFGVSLIQSAPKTCPFRYDLIWCKSSSCGFLLAKKMPMRKHEMIYVFYEKLPYYDLSSHKHKFIDKEDVKSNNIYHNHKVTHYNERKGSESMYDPPLPNSLIKEEVTQMSPVSLKNSDIYGKDLKITTHYCDKDGKRIPTPDAHYEPPLPNSLLEIKSTRGKHSTEKPVELMKWILKYYSKAGDIVLDPTMGSGSMGVACLELKRNFIGIEMDDEIFDVAYGRLNEV
tara:strand:+ start:46 stop:927 length:882 start_codon:yes stop_codon:yes gene_type:complete